MALNAKRREEFGKDIAFGLEQTLACFATDFIDPYVGQKIQDKLQPAKAGDKSGSFTWGGEVAGDFAALGAFLGLQRFAPQISRAISAAIAPVMRPFYNWTGKQELHKWARLHGVDKESESFKARLSDYTRFQIDSAAKSTIVATGSIVFNVMTQKMMGNFRKIWVITAAKLAGAVLTLGVMLGMRLVLPDTMEKLDSELSERYFSPMIRFTQKMLGTGVHEKPHDDENQGPSFAGKEKKTLSHMQSVAEEKLAAETGLKR